MLYSIYFVDKFIIWSHITYFIAPVIQQFSGQKLNILNVYERCNILLYTKSMSNKAVYVYNGINFDDLTLNCMFSYCRN
jgi:hypothetical protein